MTDTLWNFSVATYQRPGVQEACLALQDNLGADVNILMYCCWRGALTKGEFDALIAALAPWQSHVVSGLRSVRRALKPMLAELGELADDAAALRRKIAGLELEAEKLQQTMLETHAADNPAASPPSPQTAAQNLALYFQHLQKPLDGQALGALETILGAAFPDADKGGVKAAAAILS
ncbi:MAG: TIGR02444 family protein [Rhodospirillaceae bacterium]|nr:TIGR02444 family protein [Rhodospirillaceae bacterium]MBT3626761.1 TIGR02444 family protein [Rhodospirillaceae bacterium]MBT3927341.1 TIGR02444 family protein [Rhodospirillaceae bacterium]MBT4427956.1 TIGR02444 family protein [Rhodospirillaceae bacterium]MBT5038802.1 TIGR02444 family protein [Rhodospirillaceae bacterium]